MSFSWGQIHVWCWHNITCYVKLFSCVQLFVTLWTVAHQALCPWNFSGKNTGVGCRALLQGIVLTQGSNPHFLGLCIAGGFFTHWAISTCYPGMQWGEFTSGGICLIYLGFGNQGHIFLKNWDMARKKKPEWTSVTVSGLFCFSLGIILWF